MESLNRYIDHTILKPDATEEDVIRLCKEARDNNFASVCINSCHIALAKRELEGSEVKVCTVIGFPLGATLTEVKAFETKRAFELGCDEFDMVINIGALKEKRYDFVLEDIKAVVDSAMGRCVKVIIETGLLNAEEKAKISKIASSAGATFVKTCTGFAVGKATPEDVALMKANVSENVKVKASGGIRTKEDAQELIKSGAKRLGTSSGISIIK